MTSKEIREQFFSFFKEKGHKIVPSAPVVPFDDPTLLFTNAGMNQFKDVFLGNGKRDYSRASDTQKCIRVSGKHNDLDEVGYDTYHHTFFEMLGNWSFGDYYKKEAITWAWELLTDVWKLPKERLWATVYNDDDESYKLWKTETDIDPNHVLRFGEKDNFWEMGETGPCGPSSEIHINTGNDYDNPKYVNAGVPECIELWNLVFIQYNKDEKGKLHDLPMKHIDTGMGFERMCAILQNKKSNYDTDVFSPLIEQVVKLSGMKNDSEENKIPMRVIADHIRTLTFAIADGAVPGNEGRGYVLRRILRRAARYGRKLNLNDPFLYKLVDTLVKTMGEVFPEIKDKKNYVKKIIKAEEESFNATLDRGIELFEEVIKILEKRKEKIIPGEDVFKLYDTYGFPLDLTNVMAHEKGFTIDEDGFNKLMSGQKQKSREASKSVFSSLGIGLTELGDVEIEGIPKTIFMGYNYDQLKLESKILFPKDQGDYLGLVFDRTPFYVEAGGQISDNGRLVSKDIVIPIIGVSKFLDRTIHLVEKNSEFNPQIGDLVSLEVDEKRRWDIMRNHTATHFLHAALRKVLGDHVHQAGSYVGPDHLRFDFNQFTPNLFFEVYGISQNVEDTLVLSNQKTPLDINFNLLEASPGMTFFKGRKDDITLRFSYSRYSATQIGFPQLDDGTFGKFTFSYDYFIGRSLSLSWKRDGTHPTSKSYIARNTGMKWKLSYNQKWDKFVVDFARNENFGTFAEIFEPYNYYQVDLDIDKYFSLPFKSALALNIDGGYISTEVVDFLYYFGGGLLGMKGYSFYSI
ncbi:MAG: alanine--tRNA ligase, partial [Bacteroidetes bacterium]|nr:alanine--tRNA ligase [Bacteroidota bacterium]